MRFLCLVTIDPECFRGFTAEDHRALAAESLAHDAELAAKGILVVAHALAEPSTATTVKVRRGDRFFTDGPFAELKEHIGGFLLIDVADRDAALAVAAAAPIARYGAIEVREIRSLG